MILYAEFDAGKVESLKYGTAFIKGRLPFILPHRDSQSINSLESLEKAEKDLIAECQALFGNCPDFLEFLEACTITRRDSAYELSAAMAPTATLKDLKLIALLTFILGVIDKLACNIKKRFSENNLNHPDEIQMIEALFNELTQAADGKQISAKFKTHPLFDLFKNIAQAFHEMSAIALTYSSDIEDFIFELKRWVQACLMEIKYVLHTEWPYTEATYRFLRNFTIAYPVYREAVILITHIQFPKEERVLHHLSFQQFNTHMGNMISLENDLVSLKTEILDGEEDNLILKKTTKYSLQYAIAKVQEELHQTFFGLESKIAILKRAFPHKSLEIENYIKIMCQFKDGIIHWFFSTKRYSDVLWSVSSAS